MSSSSSTTNVPKSARGMAPLPAIFPNVITSPGSPPGNQPPVTHTIVQAFTKQRAASGKAAIKAGNHADTKLRIITFLAPPPSHQDPLRNMSVDQLATLSDPDLVHQALQLLTTDNLSGSFVWLTVRLVILMISMRDCIIEFVNNSKTREGRELKKQLNERLGELKALLDVERFTNKQTDDGSEFSPDGDFSMESSQKSYGSTWNKWEKFSRKYFPPL